LSDSTSELREAGKRSRHSISRPIAQSKSKAKQQLPAVGVLSERDEAGLAAVV
jgi:hypothetical protein